MYIDDERAKLIPLKLKPHECLIRLCLICGERMIPTFEYDTEFRWYHFRCKNCNTQVSVSEMINLESRKMDRSDNYNLEPLTEEEIEFMSRIEK